MTFPDQYETRVGERGQRLSGGEKQRVAIARVILKNPPGEFRPPRWSSRSSRESTLTLLLLSQYSFSMKRLPLSTRRTSEPSKPVFASWCVALARRRSPNLIPADALGSQSQGRTTLAIAHRLSTIVDSDIIHCLDEGEIVESGSHSELLAKGGVYAGGFERLSLRVSALTDPLLFRRALAEADRGSRRRIGFGRCDAEEWRRDASNGS